MKKSLFYIGVSLVVLSSCAKEIEQIKEDKIDIINEENPIQGPSKESVVIYGEVNTTKTTVDGSGIFAWQTGEKIAVVEQDMTDSDGLGFTLSDASTGAFTGTKTDGKDLVFAVSPQSALSEASESTGDVLYSLTLPATYSNYVSGTTNDIMVGTPDPGYSGDGYKFIFRQATALLKFTYANVPYGTKKFKLTTPEYITGEWLFDTTSGVSLDQTSSGGKTVTITLASTVEAVGQTMTFCVPVPAGNYTGFDIELQDAEGNTLTGTDKSKSGLIIDLVAGDIFPCPTVTLAVESLASLDYTSDGVSSESLGYGNPTNITTSSGIWVVCAHKNTGMQLNTSSKDSYITTPSFLGTIKKIVVTGTNPTYYYGNNSNVSASGGVQGSSIEGKSYIDLSSKTWSQAHIVTSGGAAVATHVDVIYEPKEIDHISLTTPPTKTTYTYGDSFDFSGAVVTAYFTDDTNTNITSLVSTDGDTVVASAGTGKTVTISFNGKTTTYTINVAKAAAGLSFGTLSYTVAPNDSFDGQDVINPNGLDVTYESSDEGLVTIDEDTGEVTIGSTTGGPVTITASTEGDSNHEAGAASYTITISTITKLDSPGSLTITAIAKTGFTATWTTVSHASGYSWTLSTSSTEGGITPANTKASGTQSDASLDGSTWTLTKSVTLTAGTYYLYVKATGDEENYTASSYSVANKTIYSVTFVPSDKSTTNGTALGTYVKNSDISLVGAKGSNSSNAPQIYGGGTELRMYQGNTVKVQGGTGVKVTAVEFTFKSTTNNRTLSASVGTYTNATDKTTTGAWAGSENDVTFTNTNGNSTQVIPTEIVITYTK